MPNYSAFIPQGEIDESIKSKVRDFILNVSRNERARWPNSHAVLLRDGKPVLIKQGDSCYDYGSEIYLLYSVGMEIPIWLPPTLSCMAQFFRVFDDEVKAAIIDIAAKMCADVFRPLRDSFIQAPDGIDITTLAINDQTRQVAGIYPPDPEDPEALPIARLPFSGEIMNINGPEWHTFSLQS